MAVVRARQGKGGGVCAMDGNGVVQREGVGMSKGSDAGQNQNNPAPDNIGAPRKMDSLTDLILDLNERIAGLEEERAASRLERDDLNARLEALETRHKVAAQLIHTLADANGYEKWKKKSKLVTL